MILVIDNYDSFVANVARYFRLLGAETLVVRNDAIETSAIARVRPDAIVLSPGPCSPNEAGVSSAIVQTFTGHIPLLGICLGHQCIGAALGGNVVAAKTPMHGRASAIDHDGTGIFLGLANPLRVARYHSLAVEMGDDDAPLRITARAPDGEIMGLAHREHPTHGVQFHPESVLTDSGLAMCSNFLAIARQFNASRGRGQ